MENPKGLHEILISSKRAYRQSKSMKMDPFVLLSAFIQGTDDLFDENLRTQVALICNLRCVKGYVELAKTIDDCSKNYADTSVELVKGHRVLCSFLKKYPFTPNETPYDTKAVATEKWFAAEAQCEATNLRLSNIANGDLPRFVHFARRLIDDTLGELTPACLMKILQSGEHGKGSTVECGFEASTVYYKYSLTKPLSTRLAMNYAKAAISLNKRWSKHLESNVVWDEIPYKSSSPAYAEKRMLDNAVALGESERISFVEKDARSMRPIGVGNSLNMFLQLGVKNVMAEKLLKCGVDLSDQSKNREMAYIGSLAGMRDDLGINPQQYSTIDLASASDTVSLGICQKLLPPDWFGLLSDLRHESGVLNGETITYSKMSAMGNGFTFPLESLIFWAVAQATAEDLGIELNKEDLAVYGDDIICPNSMSHALIENLTFCGFTVNTEKSFVSGPFKESCGADYFQGINVRPFYLKRRMDTAKDLYFVANAILPKATDIDCRVSKGYKRVYQTILIHLANQGPVLYGPLSAIIHDDPKGRKVYHDCETFLAVPLSFYNDSGFGYLSVTNKIKLFNKGWFQKGPKRWRNATLSALISSNLPYYLAPCEVSSTVKGVSESLRFITRIEAMGSRVSTDKKNRLDDRYDNWFEKYDISSNGTTKITHKRKSSTTFYLQPAPNWDGNVNKGDRKSVV